MRSSTSSASARRRSSAHRVEVGRDVLAGGSGDPVRAALGHGRLLGRRSSTTLGPGQSHRTRGRLGGAGGRAATVRDEEVGAMGEVELPRPRRWPWCAARIPMGDVLRRGLRAGRRVPEAGGGERPPFGWYHGMPTTVDVSAGFPVAGDVHGPTVASRIWSAQRAGPRDEVHARAYEDLGGDGPRRWAEVALGCGATRGRSTSPSPRATPRRCAPAWCCRSPRRAEDRPAGRSRVRGAWAAPTYSVKAHQRARRAQPRGHGRGVDPRRCPFMVLNPWSQRGWSTGACGQVVPYPHSKPGG